MGAQRNFLKGLKQDINENVVIKLWTGYDSRLYNVSYNI